MSRTRLTEHGNAAKARAAEARRDSIRALRAADPSLTRRKIADALGCSLRTVERALHGWTPPAPPTPEQVAAAERRRREVREPIPPGTASTRQRVDGERGRINRRMLRALNPGSGPGPLNVPVHKTVLSDERREWAERQRMQSAASAFSDGLVRMHSPDGSRTLAIEAAEVEHRLALGWEVAPA